MPTVCNFPPIGQLRERWQSNTGGGPVHHQVAKAKYLTANGWDTAEIPVGADILHVHGVNDLPNTDVLTIHAIWPTHVYPDHPPFWDVQNETMTRAMQRARRVVALSEYTADLCRNLAGVDVTVIPQAIDPAEWDGVTATGAFRDALGIADDRPMLLWAKNTVDVLRDPLPALDLAERRPEISVVMTADFKNIEFVAGGDVPSNVHCVGKQPFRRMQALIADCDVYLGTTLESSGQGHLEAMYLGKPVLGYDWGGLADVLPTGRYGAGEVVTPGDIEALSDAFDLVWRRRVSYGKRAQKTAEEYTWPVVIDRYIDLYTEVMNA